MLKNAAASKEEMPPSIETVVDPVQEMAGLLTSLLQGNPALSALPVDAVVEDVIETLASNQNSAVVSEIKRLVGTGGDETALRNRVKEMVLQYQQQAAPVAVAHDQDQQHEAAPVAASDEAVVVVEDAFDVVTEAVYEDVPVVQEVAVQNVIAPAIDADVAVAAKSIDVTVTADALVQDAAVIVNAPAVPAASEQVVLAPAVTVPAIAVQDVAAPVITQDIAVVADAPVVMPMAVVQDVVPAVVAQDAPSAPVAVTQEAALPVAQVAVAPTYEVVQQAEVNKNDIDNGVYAEEAPVVQVVAAIDVVRDVPAPVVTNAQPIKAPVAVTQDTAVLDVIVDAAPAFAPVVTVKTDVQENIVAPVVVEENVVVAIADTTADTAEPAIVHVDLIVADTVADVTAPFMDAPALPLDVVAANDDVAMMAAVAIDMTEATIVDVPTAAATTVSFVPVLMDEVVAPAAPLVQEKAVTALFTMQIVEQGMNAEAVTPVANEAFEDTKKDATTKADVLIEQDTGYDWWAELTGQMGGYQQPTVPYAKQAYKNVA